MSVNILFISGSLGLGHVVRDIAIANELRLQIPEIKITWLASEPAVSVLTENDESLHPQIINWAADTDIIESINEDASEKGKAFHANLVRYIVKARASWLNNVKLFDQIIKNENYDLIIGDETYELSLALSERKLLIKPPFIMLYDFIGIDTVTKNPLEKFAAYRMNYKWAKANKASRKTMTNIIIGTTEDIPDKNFGFLLPNRKESVKDIYSFAGYILQFNPEDYKHKYDIRRKLGFGSEPLIVCSVGGTAIGLPLLELCCKTFPLLNQKLPGLKMVLVSGPRISSQDLKLYEGIILKQYIPRQYEYLAASDLAIVQAGSTTTLELIALQKPFIYFPVQGHFEQQLHVTPRLERLKAGKKMQLSETTPEMLVNNILSDIGKQVDYPSIPLDGAKNIVKIAKQLLKKSYDKRIPAEI